MNFALDMGAKMTERAVKIEKDTGKKAGFLQNKGCRVMDLGDASGKAVGVGLATLREGKKAVGTLIDSLKDDDAAKVLTKQAEELGESLGKQAGAMKDSVVRQARDLKKSMDDAADQIQASTDELVNDFADYVRKWFVS